jgi:hypothetical protein
VTWAEALGQGGWRQVGRHPSAQQITYVIGPLLVSLINHEYQHDCRVREGRAMLGRTQLGTVWSSQVQQVDGSWGLQVGMTVDQDVSVL